MITAYFRQIDGDAYGLAVAETWASLFLEIGAYADPFSVEIYETEGGTSVCWDIDGEKHRKQQEMIRKGNYDPSLVDFMKPQPVQGRERTIYYSDQSPDVLTTESWYAPDWRSIIPNTGDPFVEELMSRDAEVGKQ